MDYNKDKLISLLHEQIYDKSDKSKQLRFSPENIHRLVESIDKKLEIKCICFIHYIEKLLSYNIRTNTHYVFMQLIKLNHDDEKLISYIGKNRTYFYAIKNHLIKNRVIFKVEKSTYFVNPYFISNIPYQEWKKVKSKINDGINNKTDQIDDEVKTWGSNEFHDLINS